MSTYTDVFGNDTIPPSGLGYASFTLTTDATFVWPYNTDGSQYPVAKVMDVACAAGNAITLPDAREVSAGEDFLIRNVGSNALIVKDAVGVQIALVAVGAASYFYLTDNTTAAGVYGVIGFGIGTSTVDAASLVGYGIKAVGASLNQSHPSFPTYTPITIDADHRAKLVVFTGGAGTFNLTSAATLGDDYFTLFRNEGTGTATLDPASGELIDGLSTLQIQPNESLMLICTGTQWYTVGYGRSVLYQFTQLTKDVSAGGTITLSAAEAANKLLTFIGNPSGAVNVVVPSIVAVYYTQSAVSTAQTITLKTVAGSGVPITQGARIIALCDGTNVVSAQSAVANTSVSLTDGSVTVPSLYFATSTNTGLYKSGAQDLGVTVNGSAVGVFGSTGLQGSTIGANSTQRHTVPAVSSDTVALLAATQTFTNKTFISPTITGAALTGGTINNSVIGGVTPAAGTFTTLTTTGNIELGNASDTTLARSAAGVVTIEGVEVVTLSRSQTLTNKTLTAPVISTISNTGTLTLPTSTDTLVGRATTDTLTNKTISVDANTVSGIAASSFVLSNASGNIDGTAAQKVIPTGAVVGTTDTQTLTNKTISGASNTLSNIGNASLTNSSITINGNAVSLGGSTTVTATATNALTIGTGLSGTSYNGSAPVTIAIDSTVATLTGSQTLTNKTLSTGSTWQGNAIAVTYGGTGLTGIAALSVPVANALNTYTYVTATAGQSIRINAGGTAWEAFTPSTNSGTVTTVSVTSANGFAGTVANATSTPAITLSTSVTGVLKGNGTAISAATAGTDYQAPLVSGTNIKTVNSTSLLGSGNIAVGTVTSVTGISPIASSGGTTPAISLSSGYGDTQNPYASKTANYVLAAPNGTTGAPTFRAIVAADIPTLNQNTTGTASNVTGTVAVANGGTGATTLTGLVKGNGTSAFSAATAGTDYVAPGTATTFTATQTLNGSSSTLGAVLLNSAETTTVSATAATGTIAYYPSSQSVLYYTTNASANWTVNLTFSAGTTMNTAMSTGQSMTMAFLVTQGATAYYNNVVQVDGTTSGVTTIWQGGAPTKGNASGVDVYTYTVIKTGSATFTVLASQVQFK